MSHKNFINNRAVAESYKPDKAGIELASVTCGA